MLSETEKRNYNDEEKGGLESLLNSERLNIGGTPIMHQTLKLNKSKEGAIDTSTERRAKADDIERQKIERDIE